MALWHPDAVRMPEPDNGTYTGGPPKALLHSTEVPFGKGWAYYTGASKPHLEVIGDLATKRIKLRQFYPRNMPARSLQDDSGWVRTNRDSVFQIEMGYRSADVADVPNWFWEQLADDVLRWVEINHGVDPDVWADFAPYPWVLNNPVRFSSAKWDNFNGWCGHQHAPENTHGDPGDIPVNLLRADWFNMATKDDLRAVLDEKISADNPAFVNAVRVAMDQEVGDESGAGAFSDRIAQKVWDAPLTHPNGTTAKARTWLMYTNTKVDDLRAWLAGKLGA